MLRTATALLALISVLAVPMISSACMLRCESSPIHTSAAVCHEKAHQQVRSHMHDMEHMPGVTRQTLPHMRLASLPCHTVMCSSMKPAQIIRPQVASRCPSVFPSLTTTSDLTSPAVDLVTGSRSASPASNIGPALPPSPLRI